MFDYEITQVPTGFLIPTAKYGSFPTTISAVKCIMELVKSVEIGAVSLQLDRNLQPLLDRAWLKKEHLSPICEGDPLIGEGMARLVSMPEGIWHFFFFVVNYAHKNGIPCFASQDRTTEPGERLKICMSLLYDLYSLHGATAHVCSLTRWQNLFSIRSKHK